MDGFYTDNLPSLVANTITVSPFSGDASNCPRNEKTECYSWIWRISARVYVLRASETQ